MKHEIRKIITDIACILSSNDELSWAKEFENLGSALDMDYESSLRSLKALYGGMGSFNDLVLHKEGIPLLYENRKLNNLRRKLYNQLELATAS
ncbi:DUF6966 domain-containing protein [Pantoea sp. FN0302]|uniref:DUF6966 domain-containing protein n=1 Tax=unclassified Pantoea TaxID=2630326 RepID=UPI003CF3A2E6